MPFFDSDKEIELALGCSIKEYFTTNGESIFRILEERVIIDKVKNNEDKGSGYSKLPGVKI